MKHCCSTHTHTQTHTYTHTLTLLSHAVAAHGTRPLLIKAALCAQIPVVAGSSPANAIATTKWKLTERTERERWRDSEWEKEEEEGEAQKILGLHHTHIHTQTWTLQQELKHWSISGNVSKQQIILALFFFQVTANSCSSSSTVWICISFFFFFLKKGCCPHNMDLRQGALFQSTRTKRSQNMPQLRVWRYWIT